MKVVAVNMLVRWEWVEGKVPVVVGPPVVAWRRVVCPVNAAGPVVLSIGPDKPTRRATKTQLGRSLGLLLSSTRRQSAAPSHASQSACWLSGGGGGCFRLRVVAGCGVGVGEGVSSELLDGGGGGRTRGLEGAESQEEVGEGKLIG